MQRIIKDPVLLGWLTFGLSSLLLAWLFGLWVSPFLGEIFPFAIFILINILNDIVGFFVFCFSVSKVVLPLYQNREISVTEITRITFGSYLLRWFLYLVFYVAYCIPLSFRLLPADIERPVYLVWQILASFLAYRGVVRSWLDDFILQHKQDDKNQVAIVDNF